VNIWAGRMVESSPIKSAEPGPFSLVVEDLRSHREGLLAQGFWALLVFRLSAPRKHVKNRLLRGVWRVGNVLGQKIIEVLTGITLAEGASIGRRVIIEHHSGIIVHGNAVIGDECVLRQGVTIGNRSLDDPAGAPTLGRGVNVGAGAKIIGRVHIGDYASIGANAVVLSDVPPGALAVGVPAVVKSKRVQL